VGAISKNHESLKSSYEMKRTTLTRLWSKA